MKRALLFGGVPIIAGIVLIVMWALADQEASRGHDWTQVLATIETATVQPGAVTLAYKYNFRDSEHRNPTGNLTIREGSDSSAIAARYAPGRQILAYVNPTAPAESLLEPTPRPPAMRLIIGLVLIAMALPIAIFYATRKPVVTGRRGKGRRPTRPMSRLKPPSSPLNSPTPSKPPSSPPRSPSSPSNPGK